MSFSGNFQRPNPPIPPQTKPPAQSEEEKALVEQKRRIEEDLKKAQADLKKQGRMLLWPAPVFKNQQNSPYPIRTA